MKQCDTSGASYGLSFFYRLSVNFHSCFSYLCRKDVAKILLEFGADAHQLSANSEVGSNSV